MNPYYQRPAVMHHVKIIYVHGFLGSIKTFKDLPSRLGALLHQRYPNILVDNNIYLYKTKGKYREADDNLYEAILYCIRELWNRDPNPLIILVGHSMGGLVAADTIHMINKQGFSPLPNGAKVIGLLAYDTPYFSIDKEFIKNGIKIVTGEPLSAAWHMYASKQTLEEKSTGRRAVEKFAGTIVKGLNHVVSDLKEDLGELLIHTFIAAAVLLAAFAFYAYKELDHSLYAVDQDRLYPNNYIIIADDRSHSVLYAKKVLDYLTFALENFRSDTKLNDRVRKLKINPNIKFKCIYNTVPKLTSRNGIRAHSQFIRTNSELYDQDLFQVLQWPADPFGRTRPPHFNGGAESVLAHIQMFGSPQSDPHEANPTLDRLLHYSVNFLAHAIDSHFSRPGYPPHHYAYQ